jgi:hypothetical protein
VSDLERDLIGIEIVLTGNAHDYRSGRKPEDLAQQLSGQSKDSGSHGDLF